MGFGIKCPIADYSGAWWGGRAILERSGHIDVVHDRHQMEGGTDQERKEMSDWLNNVGIPHLKKFVKEKGLYPDEERRVVIAREGYTLVANPQKSYGYLYMGCWKGETEPDQSIPGPLVKKLRKGSKWYFQRSAGFASGFSYGRKQDVEVYVIDHDIEKNHVKVRFKNGTTHTVFRDQLFK